MSVKLLAELEASRMCNGRSIGNSIASIERSTIEATEDRWFVHPRVPPPNAADRTRFRCYVSRGGVLLGGVLQALHISRFDCGRRFAFHDS